MLLGVLAFIVRATVDAVQRKGDRPDAVRLTHAGQIAGAIGLDMRTWFVPDVENCFGRINRAGILTAIDEAKGTHAHVAKFACSLDDHRQLGDIRHRSNSFEIGFDLKRAAAGFRVLGELAKKTQVLFFTHHEHLLEVARKALGVPVSGVTLPVVSPVPRPQSEAA